MKNIVLAVAVLILFSGAAFADAAVVAVTPSPVDCKWYLDRVLPTLSGEHSVISDPDAVAAFVEALKASHATVPDGVTRVLLTTSSSGTPGYGLEAGGCLGDFTPLVRS